MSQSDELLVTDKNGVRGLIDAGAPPPFDGSGANVLVRLENNRPVIVPTEAMVARHEQGFFLPLDLTELESPPASSSVEGARASSVETLVMPVLMEELLVRKRRVETGRVRITKKVHEREEIVDEALLKDEVDVRRVSLNQVVNEAPPIRYEGNTMIVPVLEEVLVVEKRLMLKEELHITKRAVETHEPQRVMLRSEEATIERVDLQPQTPEDEQAKR